MPAAETDDRLPDASSLPGTGAGWGGCTVSLLPANVSTTAFRQALRRRYAPYAALTDAELAVAVLESKPGSGAGVYRVA